MISLFACLEPLSVVPTFVSVSCNGAGNGEIHLTVAGKNNTILHNLMLFCDTDRFVGGNLTTYSIEWVMANGTTRTVHNSGDLIGLAGGNYSYTIVDANGCQFSGSITIQEPCKYPFL